MISYQEACKRQNTTPLCTEPHKLNATWEEVEVGTRKFWHNALPGVLLAFESATDIYVGKIESVDSGAWSGGLWVYLYPDNTKDPLPEDQKTLPVMFGLRDKLMMEITEC